MGFKYSVLFDTLDMLGFDVYNEPQPLLEKIAAAGFNGIDLCGDNQDHQKMKDIVKSANALGLKLSAVLGAWGYWHAGEERDLASSDENVRTYALKYAKLCVDRCVDWGSTTFEICVVPKINTYPALESPRKIVFENFCKSMRELCEYAAKYDVVVTIEPINRFEGYTGFVNSVCEATQIINHLGIDNLAVLGDLFHMNIEDRSVPDAIRTAGPKLRHIHLTDSNRQIPGTGHIDYKEVLRTLIEVDFQGYLLLDCLPVSPDIDTYLDTINYMKRLESVVELQAATYALKKA